MELAVSLAIIFNKSLAEGVVPIDWKLENVTPLFKKGSKTEPRNYRPVSLTSVSAENWSPYLEIQLCPTLRYIASSVKHSMALYQIGPA